MAALAAATNLDRLRVVLVATRNPLNIGAAARAMTNFGAGHLRVVNPYGLAFREARSAVGASSVLATAEEYHSLADGTADCTLVVGTTAAQNRELQHPLRDLPSGARLIRRALATGRVALLFGSEKRGLTNADLSHCHWLLRVPTRPDQPSMNLGQAVAICLYELARPAPAHATLNSKSATAGELERLTMMLFDILTASGYVKPRATGARDKLRRAVRRLHLGGADAELWLGMLRQILWKVRP